MLSSPPVDHYDQQHYEAEQSESRHHHQGDDPHHPAHPRLGSVGHVGQDGPVWNMTHTHKYTPKIILLTYKQAHWQTFIAYDLYRIVNYRNHSIFQIILMANVILCRLNLVKNLGSLCLQFLKSSARTNRSILSIIPSITNRMIECENVLVVAFNHCLQ